VKIAVLCQTGSRYEDVKIDLKQTHWFEKVWRALPIPSMNTLLKRVFSSRKAWRRSPCDQYGPHRRPSRWFEKCPGCRADKVYLVSDRAFAGADTLPRPTRYPGHPDDRRSGLNPLWKTGHRWRYGSSWAGDCHSPGDSTTDVCFEDQGNQPREKEDCCRTAVGERKKVVESSLPALLTVSKISMSRDSLLFWESRKPPRRRSLPGLPRTLAQTKQNWIERSPTWVVRVFSPERKRRRRRRF